MQKEPQMKVTLPEMVDKKILDNLF